MVVSGDVPFFWFAVMKIQRNLRIVLARRRENEAEVMALLQVTSLFLWLR
jgi:hypothetical protein